MRLAKAKCTKVLNSATVGQRARRLGARRLRLKGCRLRLASPDSPWRQIAGTASGLPKAPNGTLGSWRLISNRLFPIFPLPIASVSPDARRTLSRIVTKDDARISGVDCRDCDYPYYLCSDGFLPVAKRQSTNPKAEME